MPIPPPDPPTPPGTGNVTGIYVNMEGTWRTVDTIYINIGGTWTPALLNLKQGGVWKS